MNPDFLKVISASVQDRQGLFLATATRLGTPIQNVEKDFWVTWTLDLLFNGRQAGEPRLLFKGGTSLSKAYGLISRFSEDIDITVFREDIGQHIEVENLEGLSGKKQRQLLDEIKEACQSYIQGSLLSRLNGQIHEVFASAGIPINAPVVVSDPDDPDQQTLLVRYPTVSAEPDSYIKPTVKIEAGAKSALDPHKEVTIKPYLSDDLAGADLLVSNVVTIDAERTFWDKVVILHGMRKWHDNNGVVRQQGNRVSRHYYDLYRLFNSEAGASAIKNPALGADCVRHALMFFNRPAYDLQSALEDSYAIAPTAGMIDELKRDYQTMTGMIFGEVPDFSSVLDSITELQTQINMKSL
jgi:hypothetical protein